MRIFDNQPTEGVIRVMSAQAYYRPQVDGRQAPVNPQHTAICFIDTQNYNCSKNGAIYKSYLDNEKEVQYSCSVYWSYSVLWLPSDWLTYLVLFIERKREVLF